MDEDDLTAIIERFGDGAAHVTASSFGALTTLGVAARRPDWSELDTRAIATSGHRTLLTKGTASPAWLQVVTDLLAEHLPHAETAAIEGAGHSPHITHPDEFGELIGTFLSDRAGVPATAR
jgi:pimeloyl-ACP methyl ester carboxylesterase